MRVITVARKPLSESTVAANVLKHGTGAINIDATRLPTTEEEKATINAAANSWKESGATNVVYGQGLSGGTSKGGYGAHDGGRWPANMILCHKPGCGENGCVEGCPVADLDRQCGGASGYFKQVR